MHELLYKIAAQHRALQLTAHMFHNICARVSFFSDHEEFGSLYGMHEGMYDSAVERSIGLFGMCNIKQAHQMAMQRFMSAPDGAKENKEMFIFIIQLENELNSLLNAACKHPECSEGTRQMLGDQADKIEVVLYKLKQRVK